MNDYVALAKKKIINNISDILEHTLVRCNPRLQYVCSKQKKIMYLPLSHGGAMHCNFGMLQFLPCQFSLQ